MESTDKGWQAPRISRRPQGLPEPPTWPLHNQFAGLPNEVIEEDTVYSQKFLKLPARLLKTPKLVKTKLQLTIITQEMSPTEVNHSKSVQPYGNSYFLPKKTAGKAASFLLYTGYTINLLSLRLFDTLGAHERANIQSYEGAHGTLANG